MEIKATQAAGHGARVVTEAVTLLGIPGCIHERIRGPQLAVHPRAKGEQGAQLSNHLGVRVEMGVGDWVGAEVGVAVGVGVGRRWVGW